MHEAEEAQTLEEVVRRIGAAGAGERVSVAEIMQSVGQRSFGPLLLVPGLLLVSPLSGIPGSGTIGGLIIGIVSLHLILGRRRIWLPSFLLSRAVPRARLTGALRFLTPAIRVVDRLINRRFSFLTEGAFARLIGVICLSIACFMPPMELVPMSNSAMAAAVSLFALALVAHDGLLATLAFLATGAVGYLVLETLPM
ncbi:exopolysaccharide biosynthesis protein [Aquibaculum sediminis]|uniref:exopolysaccharide biosynthesis protein n=1 Tax=Aquibaculum sediminis TaxID=3231907 RepID=UPI0034552A34